MTENMNCPKCGSTKHYHFVFTDENSTAYCLKCHTPLGTGTLPSAEGKPSGEVAYKSVDEILGNLEMKVIALSRAKELLRTFYRSEMASELKEKSRWVSELEEVVYVDDIDEIAGVQGRVIWK